jgi:DNA polymerase-3 subunit alpha
MFIHLHCHSDRSVGRSLIKPSQLVDRYVQMGSIAACLTDNGNMNGCIQLYNACKKKNLKTIFGMEVNVTPDRNLKDQKINTMVLLAKNLTGFRNLIKIATIGSMFFYYAPRVDIETIRQHREGLICLTSDCRGYVADKFFVKGQEALMDMYELLSDIFGDDVYWEIQPAQFESQRVFNEWLIENAKGFDKFKLVASGDPHYVAAEDQEFHQKYQMAKNSRNPYYQYSLRGPHHILNEDEVCALFDLLHGQGFVKSNPVVQDAIMRPADIARQIETFDLREGTKVPTFI